METRAHYVVIGSMVLAAIAAAFLFVIKLTQTQTDFDEYDVIFTERVSGLSVGAAVRFNGIQKGEVDTLSIDPTDPSIVIARVRVDKDTPVKTDTKAELELVGFTGLAIIQFVGGGADKPLLKDASDDDVPKIKADTSGFAAFLEGSGDVLAQASRLLSDENISGISGIITNIETMTGAFAEHEDDIAASLANINAITTDLAQVTSKLDAAATSLQSFMENDAPATAQEIEALLSETQALVSDLRSITNENRASIRVFADQGLGQVAPALSEARRLMRTLDAVLREIDRDPNAYFFGERAPEYTGGEE
ncbi:MlaD family protein [Hyphococcus sp.]|uniref:MlaD family protein n=1 Tax=Hyphococcus sp. TaxID=2038636 RepID=UPI00207F2CB0|nr:MAG: ABC transporter substrate-binding protein [Marinicaulis sp.]